MCFDRYKIIHTLHESYSTWTNYLSLYRFDAGNREALILFDEGDVVGFAKATHPLVSVLLHRSVEWIEISHRDYFGEDEYFVDNYSDDDDSYP